MQEIKANEISAVHQDREVLHFLMDLVHYPVFSFTEDEIINWLMISKNNINRKDYKGRSILHLAAIKGIISAIKRFLDAGADPNSIQDTGHHNTPLHWAIANANTTCAEWVILNSEKYDINLNLADKNGNTPLHLAVLKGWEHIDSEGRDNKPFKTIIKLLAEKADVNQKNRFGHTPLHYAVLHRNTECIATLLKHGARWDELDLSELTPLDMLNLPYDKTNTCLKTTVGVYTLKPQSQWNEDKAKLYKFFSTHHNVIAKIQDDIFSHPWKLGLGGGENVYFIKDQKPQHTIKVSHTAKEILDTIEDYWRIIQRPEFNVDLQTRAAKNCLTKIATLANKGANRNCIYSFFHRQDESSKNKYKNYTQWISESLEEVSSAPNLMR